jgi:hypothetical protein
MLTFKEWLNETEVIPKIDLSNEDLRIVLLQQFYDPKKYDKKELEIINIMISTFAQCIEKKLFVPEKIFKDLSKILNISKEELIKIFNDKASQYVKYREDMLLGKTSV